MRGVILAGGSGSRLQPLTRAVNKHLLPVGGIPMIDHGLGHLRAAGIEEILVITGPEHLGQLAAHLGDGADHGVEISYRVQARPGGVAEALALAEGFAHGEPLAVMLGDNVFRGDVGRIIRRYRAQGCPGARIVVVPVDDPERYGVAELADGKLVSVVEKPAAPRSNLAVVGLYLYDARVFDVIRGIARSARGELEISDVNARYLAIGELSHEPFHGEWIDAGTHPAYRMANSWFDLRPSARELADAA
jgi:glucose-1-phosphate thymidylyltransferase